MSKQFSARKTTFFQAEVRHEIEWGYPSTKQMKVSERHTEPKKAEKKKTHQFHRIKKKQRSHPQDSGNFLYLKPQKLKTAKKSSKKYLDSLSRIVQNKPGTAQVGAMSKAQKYSRNNFWKHFGNFFSKKVFGKKVA